MKASTRASASSRTTGFGFTMRVSTGARLATPHRPVQACIGQDRRPEPRFSAPADRRNVFHT